MSWKQIFPFFFNLGSQSHSKQLLLFDTTEIELVWIESWGQLDSRVAVYCVKYVRRSQRVLGQTGLFLATPAHFMQNETMAVRLKRWLSASLTGLLVAHFHNIPIVEQCAKTLFLNIETRGTKLGQTSVRCSIKVCTCWKPHCLLSCFTFTSLFPLSGIEVTDGKLFFKCIRRLNFLAYVAISSQKTSSM